jgi:hypothetical protein
MYIVHFVNTVKLCDQNKSFKEKIKDEEANIIIHCNKLLFKLKITKNISDKMSNKKVLNLIEGGSC